MDGTWDEVVSNERTNEWMTPLEDAPAEILALREKLSAFAGKDANYLTLVGYADEKDHITWHKHREDDGQGRDGLPHFPRRHAHVWSAAQRCSP